MDHKQRYRRLRLLISKLNKERKKQTKKIDILCNDLIAAQRDFIKRLDTISFTANFYETIAGITELSSLILLASKLIKDEIRPPEASVGRAADANVAFFLRQGESFELHIFESAQPILLEKQGLENCFTPEVVDNICKSNKICTLDDMFAMGLQGNLTRLNEISAATIPLSGSTVLSSPSKDQLGPSLGFILIYRSCPTDKLRPPEASVGRALGRRASQNKLTADELNNIAAISPGLSRTIASCRSPRGEATGVLFNSKLKTQN